MEKKYTIQDVAKLLDLSPDTIRLYEKEDLAAPLRDQQTGIFYYDFPQIHRIMGISLYQQLNVSLPEIRELLALSSFTEVSEKYSTLIERNKQEMEFLQKRVEKLRFMQHHIDTLNQGIGTFCIQELPDYYVLYDRNVSDSFYRNVADIFSSPVFSFGNFCTPLKMQETGKYHSNGVQFIVRKPMMDLCSWDADRTALTLQPGCRCLYTVTQAPFEDNVLWDMEGLMTYAAEHHYTCAPYAHAFYVYSLQQEMNIVNYYEIFLPIL